MRPQKLTKIQSNHFKNQHDIIYRTHLYGIFARGRDLDEPTNNNTKKQRNHELLEFNEPLTRRRPIFLGLLFHISRTKMLAFLKLEKYDIIKI